MENLKAVIKERTLNKLIYFILYLSANLLFIIQLHFSLPVKKQSSLTTIENAILNKYKVLHSASQQVIVQFLDCTQSTQSRFNLNKF
jgi:hypothetical protein